MTSYLAVLCQQCLYVAGTSACGEDNNKQLHNLARGDFVPSSRDERGKAQPEEDDDAPRSSSQQTQSTCRAAVWTSRTGSPSSSNVGRITHDE